VLYERLPIPARMQLHRRVEVSGNVFRREGQYWTVAYDGSVVRLKDAKGLRHLARLLAHPAREFHRLDLGFAAYRVVSVLPFLATWTTLYYALGRRLLPVMAARWVFNGGTALALALGQVG